MKVLVGLIYLLAGVAANLSIAHFGPSAAVFNAFWFIGLTLVVRDYLYDQLERGRFWKMAALIGTGSALVYIINPAAQRIAIASALAFLASEVVDALVYHAARWRSWLERSNSSNFLSAAVDSLVFPTVAFGGLVWSITFGQFVAKVAGGLLFSFVLLYVYRSQRVTA